MALVPDNIVSAWYSRQSLVYRNFAYLFQNPLWQTRVPQGFSLCPYWWSAVFSILIFRPLVYITLGVAKIVALLRLGAVVRFTDRIAKAILSSEMDAPLLPTIAATAMACMAAICVTGGYYAVVAYIEAGILSSLILPVLLLVTLIVTTNYAGSRGDLDRCPVEVYARIIAILCVVLSVVLHPAATYQALVSWPLGAVGSAFHGVAFAFGVVRGWLWGVAKWVGLFLPWVLGLSLALGAYGWFAIRFMSKPIVPSRVETVSAAERRRRLKELADVFNYSDGLGSSTSTKWWECLLNRYLDSLEAYLMAPNWDPHAVRDARVEELMREAEAELEREA